MSIYHQTEQITEKNIVVSFRKLKINKFKNY